MLSFKLRALAILSVCTLPYGAMAQYTSSQPIKIISAQAAGGGSDIATRLMAEELSQAIGRPIIVENRPGAIGTIGARAVAEAPPDGHTLLSIGGTAITAAPYLLASLSYDPQKDLMPIYRLASSPMVLLVSADSPVRTAAEFVQMVAKQPGKYSFASHHAINLAAMETFLREMKLDMLSVPYKIGPQALTDITGGNITAMFNDISGSAGLIQAGKLRPLAVMARERIQWFPDVPTVFDVGYRGPSVELWTGIFAPAGTSPDLIAYLNAEISKVTANPSVQARMEQSGLVLHKQSTPASFAAYIREETAALAPLLKAVTQSQVKTAR